jgi:hypothetical protein
MIIPETEARFKARKITASTFVNLLAPSIKTIILPTNKFTRHLNYSKAK